VNPNANVQIQPNQTQSRPHQVVGQKVVNQNNIIYQTIESDNSELSEKFKQIEEKIDEINNKINNFN
jgi:hypothetical protein